MGYRILSLYFGHDANMCLLQDGRPVLLNTSFNSQEPLVDTEKQAFSTWMRTDLDILVTPRGLFHDKGNAKAAKIAVA